MKHLQWRILPALILLASFAAYLYVKELSKDSSRVAALAPFPFLLSSLRPVVSVVVFLASSSFPRDDYVLLLFSFFFLMRSCNEAIGSV